MQRLLLLGLNHATAPIEVRERLAFALPEAAAAVAAFRAAHRGAEVVLLSTCNRTEMYVAHDGDPTLGPAAITNFLATHRDVPAGTFASHLYEKADRHAVEHLFAVAGSLDSMVLGETQILGQVRDAYEQSAASGTAGPVLHGLFQRALAVGKQIQTETQLADGRTSVASVAVDYARQIFDHFGDKTVLCIGAGKMARLVLQHLASLRPRELIVCNRDVDRAATLANAVGGQAVGFESLHDALVKADIVVTSTGAAKPIITRAAFDDVQRQRRYRSLFLMDIALPRDIEPAVGEAENVFLYNLDDLQQVVAATSQQRQSAVSAARAIMSRQVDAYLLAGRAREMGPTIDALYKRYHALAADEVRRAMARKPGASPAEREEWEELARRIVNKVLHDPVTALRQGSDAHAPASQYVHAIERLFRLAAKDDEPPTPSSFPSPGVPGEGMNV